MAHYNQMAGQNIRRIEALSDGVFAIALTLLVLEIKVPHVDHVDSEQTLWQEALAPLAPHFLTYFLSFMTMGIFYTGQALQLSYMERYDRNLNWYTLFFLLFISLLPFSTAFLGAYTQFKTALLIYWLNILVLGIFIYAHWNYAYKQGFILAEGAALTNLNSAVRKRIITAQSLYVLGAALCFIHVYLSIGFIIAVQLNYVFAIFSPRLPKNKPETAK